MPLYSFVKDAGPELFDTATNAGAAKEIEKYVATFGFWATPEIEFDAASATVTVAGPAADQQNVERVVLCCSNVKGVACVNDQMITISKTYETDLSQFHTVVEGDTLEKIARQYYRDPTRDVVIFEGNKPMLSNPNKLYPGQALRIPPQAERS